MNFNLKKTVFFSHYLTLKLTISLNVNDDDDYDDDNRVLKIEQVDG